MIASGSSEEIYISFMTDEDVGTAPGNWVSHAAVKVMSARLEAGKVVFDKAGRFVVGPYVAGGPSMWSGLSEFKNQSYALYGHVGQSYRLGPLEAHAAAAMATPVAEGSSFGTELCSLNGVPSSAGTGCKCDQGWAGSDCSHVDVQQTEIIYPSPSSMPNVAPMTAASWGSTIVFEDGVYHMFSDVVCQDYSPGFHEMNSNIEHSTSSTPTGPWTPVGFVVGAATTDGHTSICPRIQRAPDGSWLLFHIAMHSDATMTNRGIPHNCSGYRAATWHERRQLRHRQQHRRLQLGSKCSASNNESIRVAHSASLTGPWELTWFNGKGSSSPGIEMPWDEGTNCWVDNPGSLAMMPNGTLLLCYEVTGMPGATGHGVSPQGVGFIASDSGSWRGPWRSVTPTNIAVGYPNGHQGNAE